MQLVRLYRRVVGLLAPEWRLALALALANIALAGTGFAGPLLFGRIIDTLTASASDQDSWRLILSCSVYGA